MQTQTNTAKVEAAKKHLHETMNALAKRLLEEIGLRVARELAKGGNTFAQHAVAVARGKKLAAAAVNAAKPKGKLVLVHGTGLAAAQMKSKRGEIKLPDGTTIDWHKALHGWRRCFFTKNGKCRTGISHVWNTESAALDLLPRGPGKVKHAPCEYHGGPSRTTSY